MHTRKEIAITLLTLKKNGDQAKFYMLQRYFYERRSILYACLIKNILLNGNAWMNHFCSSSWLRHLALNIFMVADTTLKVLSLTYQHSLNFSPSKGQ